MKKILLGAVATTSLVFGSASIFNGRTETISFSSEPAGATVKVNGAPICTTPCQAKLKRGSLGTNVSIEKNGYETTYVRAETHWNGLWFIGDIFWDLGTTDAITGAWYEYDKNKYFVELKQESN